MSKPPLARIVPKEQALWEKVKEEASNLIEQSNNHLIIQKAILALAQRKIEEQKRKA